MSDSFDKTIGRLRKSAARGEEPSDQDLLLFLLEVGAALVTLARNAQPARQAATEPETAGSETDAAGR